MVQPDQQSPLHHDHKQPHRGQQQPRQRQCEAQRCLKGNLNNMYLGS